MKKVFYLKGLSSDEEELKYLMEKFRKNDIDLIPLVTDYKDISGSSKYELVRFLSDMIGVFKEGEVNIICHSMGCNIGLLLANSLDNIDHLIFISPEFIPITKTEQKFIVESTRESKYKSKKSRISISKIKSLLLFLKSKKWVNEELKDFLHKNIDTSVIYSKGDKYVSRNQIDRLSRVSSIECYEIDSNNHNPLLEETDAIELIKNQLEDVKVIRL